MFFRFVVLVVILVSPITKADQHVVGMIEDARGIIAQKTAYDAALERGRERAALCSYCHGKDGNSLRPEIPNLAGQTPGYLLRQFENFATGKRKNYVMQALAKKLGREERIDLALHFSSYPVTPSYDGPANQAGERIYKSICGNCHGAQARGTDEFPRLAGQRPKYVRDTLLNFKKHSEVRRNSVMDSVVEQLSEQDIDNVAQYLAGMN